MSLNPLAPACLPHYHFRSDPPLSLCNPTTMSLSLAQLFCGMPPPIIPSPAPPITQPITVGTFILPFNQPMNPSEQDAEAHSPLPVSSSLFSSPLEHQAQCLQAIHKTNSSTLEGRTARPQDITNCCSPTRERLCLTALLAFLLGWNNLQQGYCR